MISIQGETEELSGALAGMDGTSGVSMVTVEQARHMASARRGGLTWWDIWAGIVPLLALSPWLLLEFQALWLRPHMRFFPLVLLAVAVWVAFARRCGETVDPRRQRIAAYILLLAALLGLVAALQASPWWAHISAVLLLPAWGLGRLGAIPGHRIWGWTALLLLTVPLPGGSDIALLNGLHRTAAWAVGHALDALGIVQVTTGDVIQIRDYQVVASDVCAGWGSMYALLALGVFLALMQHRSLAVAIVSLLSAPLWVILSDFVMLLVALLMFTYRGRDVAAGFDHQLMLAAAFMGNALFLWMTQVFAARMLQPVPIADAGFGQVFSLLNTMVYWPLKEEFSPPDPDDEVEAAAFMELRKAIEEQMRRFVPTELRDMRRLRWVVQGAVVALIVAGMPVTWVIARHGAEAWHFGFREQISDELANIAKSDFLPSEVDGMKRISFEQHERRSLDGQGRLNLVWRYLWNGQVVEFSVRLPYRHWQDAGIEYARLGFTVLEARPYARSAPASELLEVTGSSGSIDRPEGSGRIWPWQEVQLQNDLGGRSYLFLSALDRSFSPWLDIPGVQMPDAAQRAYRSSRYAPETLIQPTLLRIEMSVESGLALQADEKRQLQRIYMKLRDRVREGLVKGSAGGFERPAAVDVGVDRGEGTRQTSAIDAGAENK